jgi:anti-sigma regulatory factor (Ser/Thr protein kinase)
VDASEGELVVVVADEGVGKDRFTTRAAPGLGMGLALIRELCASVRIESTNTGTTVTMRFATTRVDPPASRV